MKKIPVGPVLVLVLVVFIILVVFVLMNKSMDVPPTTYINYFLPKARENSQPIKSISGRYNGSDFETALNNKSSSIVPGILQIEGNHPLKLSIHFNGYRFKSGLFSETVTVISGDGQLIAEALYLDSGSNMLSEVKLADYQIRSATGNFKKMEGQYMRVHFDNKSKGKPRQITFV